MAATAAKLDIARQGGQVLIDMAERGERATGHGDQRAESRGGTPLLPDLGLTKNRSSRWQQTARLSEGRFADILDAAAGLSAALGRLSGIG